MEVSDKINNILNYYRNNEECDPNVYEFLILCRDYARFLKEEAPNFGIYARTGITREEARSNYPVVAMVSDNFNNLCEQFMNKLLNNDLGITKTSALYQLCNDTIEESVIYHELPDTLLRAKVGGVALYIAQQKRDERRGVISNFRYDNVEELNLMNEMDLLYPTNNSYDDLTVLPRRILLGQINEEYHKGKVKVNTK